MDQTMELPRRGEVRLPGKDVRVDLISLGAMVGIAVVWTTIDPTWWVWWLMVVVGSVQVAHDTFFDRITLTDEGLVERSYLRRRTVPWSTVRGATAYGRRVALDVQVREEEPVRMGWIDIKGRRQGWSGLDREKWAAALAVAIRARAEQAPPRPARVRWSPGPGLYFLAAYSVFAVIWIWRISTV